MKITWNTINTNMKIINDVPDRFRLLPLNLVSAPVRPDSRSSVPVFPISCCGDWSELEDCGSGFQLRVSSAMKPVMVMGEEKNIDMCRGRFMGGITSMVFWTSIREGAEEIIACKKLSDGWSEPKFLTEDISLYIQRENSSEEQGKIFSKTSQRKATAFEPNTKASAICNQVLVLLNVHFFSSQESIRNENKYTSLKHNKLPPHLPLPYP